MLVVHLTALISICACVISAQNYDSKSQPLWKNLLIRHSHWAGYIVDKTGSRSMCSMRMLSSQLDDDGVVYVEFKSEDFSIEMSIFSKDDDEIIFQEVMVWDKASHMEHHERFRFTGRFKEDIQYYKFIGTVSSNNSDDIGTITLLPEGEGNIQKKKRESNIGLYVGIPVVAALICLGLGVAIIVWAFRKGYMRHVPCNYSVFKNEDSKEKPVKVDMNKTGVEIAAQPSIHI